MGVPRHGIWPLAFDAELVLVAGGGEKVGYG